MVQQHLRPPEQELLRRRLQGQEWAEIAADLHGDADALRKQLARALDRAAAVLGLDEVPDD